MALALQIFARKIKHWKDYGVFLPDGGAIQKVKGSKLLKILTETFQSNKSNNFWEILLQIFQMLSGQMHKILMLKVISRRLLSLQFLPGHFMPTNKSNSFWEISLQTENIKLTVALEEESRSHP